MRICWFLGSLLFCFQATSSLGLTVFRRVSTLHSTTQQRDNVTVYNCAQSCVAKTFKKDFCFGFSFPTPGDKCESNMSPQIPEYGDYYMLADYRSTVADRNCGNIENTIQTINNTYGDTFTSRIFNGSLLLFDNVRTTSEQCRAKCAGIGMFITSIHSNEENQFIRDTVCTLFYLPMPECNHYIFYNYHICHVGIEVRGRDTPWIFSDGTPVDYNTDVVFSYTAADDEGNLRQEECVQMQTGLEWNDSICNMTAASSNCVCRKFF